MDNPQYNWVNQMVKHRLKTKNKAKKLIDIIDEMNLKEIGHILDVSESRVSQIHGQAMIKLKAKINDWIN